MLPLVKWMLRLFCFMFLIFPVLSNAADTVKIPILCYHNLNPTRPGSMNMTPQKFEEQIKWILNHGFTIIPLQEAVEYLQGKRDTLPKKSVVVTADDGWKSVYTYMLPIVLKYRIPVTLFIYPQTISEGKNALSWNELIELQKTGLFDVQGHTYDHPNFKHAKKRLSAENYDKYVVRQLAGSKKILEDKLNIKVSYLAWPFGIYDANLESQADQAGYVMSFTIDARAAKRTERSMAQPRYMIVDDLSSKTFEHIIKQANS